MLSIYPKITRCYNARSLIFCFLACFLYSIFLYMLPLTRAQPLILHWVHRRSIYRQRQSTMSTAQHQENHLVLSAGSAERNGKRILTMNLLRLRNVAVRLDLLNLEASAPSFLPNKVMDIRVRIAQPYVRIRARHLKQYLKHSDPSRVIRIHEVRPLNDQDEQRSDKDWPQIKVDLREEVLFEVFRVDVTLSVVSLGFLVVLARSVVGVQTKC